MSHTAYEKRVRRRITGRTQLFFAVVTPGFEDLLYQEILSLPIVSEDVSKLQGGVLFRGKVHDGYKANLHLRTASRILMRIVEFKATNFRQLKKKLSGIEWELYLQPNMIPSINVSARHSRLFHSDAIESYFQDAIRLRFETLSLVEPMSINKNVQHDVYVRISDDVFTVSIDSSGELLYKRGLKTHPALAPVRETIAAATLRLAGYSGVSILVDPMCGSGTFTLEGAMIVNKIPAGWFRKFAFEEWPCFRPEMWNHIRREAEEKIICLDRISVFSSDTDEIACRRLADAISENGFQNIISVSNRNFFDISAADFTSQAGHEEAGLVVINPPYGIRIGTPGNSKKKFNNILKKLFHDFSGWNFALIVPQDMIGKSRFFPMKTYPFFHGGVNLVIALGRVPSTAKCRTGEPKATKINNCLIE
jgi:putative N6-adenine-specific DNA methylase